MIEKKTLAIIKERLVDVYNPLIIFLFGSHAWGVPREKSDLDILVVVESSDEKLYKRPIRGLESLRGLKIAKDILVYTKTEFDRLAGHCGSLLYKVKNQGEKIYERA